MTYHLDCKSLKKWFLEHKRELPWREDPSPYAVWVSEVMLQQTQVQVVMPYFERWMQRFPSIAHLASASLDEVIKLWEGLGYYSRARNLHAGAQYIVEHHAGILPSTYEALAKIKGLGPYTIGAILSFAYRQRVSAVDGNVLRVIARYCALPDDIAKGTSQRKFREIAQVLLPEHEPWIISEALIELGATVCQKKPKCAHCPLQRTCQAFARGLQDELPKKTRDSRSEAIFRSVAILIGKGHVLVRRAQKGEIMSDLHEFPYFETDSQGMTSRMLIKHVQNNFQIKATETQVLPVVTHSFTRYQVTLYPIVLACTSTPQVVGYNWVPMEQLKTLAYSSGHRRILNLLEL